MTEENRTIRDVPVSEATPAEIASALREQGKKRFGDKPIFYAGPKGYTAEMLAQEIEQKTKLGREFLEVFQREGTEERLPALFHIPTESEQEQARQTIRARMAKFREEFGDSTIHRKENLQ